MKLKNRTLKGKLTELIQIRVTIQEKNRLKGLAEMYAGGNLSEWMVHGGLNAPREYLFQKARKAKKRP